MSKQQVTRLHPITIIVNFVKQIKSFIVPLIIILVGRGLNFTINPEDKDFYSTLISAGIILLFLTIVVIVSIIKWRKFVFWFEDGELRIEYGLFVKKKRYIPFERIQTLNYKEGVLHRLFKLVKVEIETAGEKSGDAEGVLTAITREQANSIEEEMRLSKQQKNLVNLEEEQEEVPIEIIEPEKKLIYRMTNKELILLASTSSSMGLLFSALAAIFSQFNDIIPYEEIYGEVQNIARFGVLVVTALVLFVVLLSWIVAIAISYVVNYGFTLEQSDNKLLISKGLLEKKRITVPMHRIQGIRLIENPLRQLFGYCRVVIDTGGSSGDEKEDSVVLLPFTKKKQAIDLLEILFPEYDWQLQQRKVPKKALVRYLLKPVYILAIPIAAISYFVYPYGLFSLILIPIFVSLAYWQYRTAGFAIDDLQLTLTYRVLSRTTFITSKRRIQSMTLKQNFFAERKDIATNEVNIMSGSNDFVGYAKHFDVKDMQDMMNWYKPN